MSETVSFPTSEEMLERAHWAESVTLTGGSYRAMARYIAELEGLASSEIVERCRAIAETAYLEAPEEDNG